MNSPNTCPKCGTTLPTDAPEGLCPACLMHGGLDTDATIKMTPSQKPSATEPTPTPLPEELAPLFPQLEIIELLGRGGMGTVYKARQPKLNRFVALKIISAEAGADPQFAERFQREAQALAKLNHPNIVSVFDFGESEGLFYFLMEFVDGANLRTLIRSGEMKPEAALALIPAFCDALQYAHDEGVVHRDIKPENVLVDKKGRVKIADFGLAKLLGHESNDHSLTMSGMTLGTPRYMAPEQMDKPETVDHRADIYSLGVVFYEMLTGEVPMGRFAPPSEKVRIDVRLDEIVLHALERDADRRYQHVSQVRDDVEKVTSKPQVASVSPSMPPAPSVAKVAPGLLAQINARGIELMIAGIALALGAFISFLVACDYNVYSSDKSGALALALVSMVSFAAGLAALIAGIFMRRALFPRSVIAIAWLLCALPAAAFVVKLPLLKVLFLPLTFGAFAGVRTLIAMKRAEFAPSDAETRWRALQVSVAVSGFVAAAVMLLWGIFATCTGPGVPPRTDMLAWLPYAFALVGAVFLLAKSSSSRHPASSDILPETVLAALGAGVAALPWRWLEKPIPNPWSLAVGSAWEYSEGAYFSLVYLVFGILLFITGGRRSHSAIRPALTLLTGIVALALLRHFVTHFPQPNGPGGWGYMDHLTNTIYPSLRYQSTFVAAVITALLTTLVGAIQLRNRANVESDAGIPSGLSVSKAASTTDEPRLSRLALWGVIWAPFTAMGWWSWQMCVRQYFDNPAQFATYDPLFLTLGVGTFIVAATAGLGSTLLGGIAIAQIKRSGGKLYGLPLAAIALLIHPLAALGGGLFLLLRMAYSAATRNWLWIPSTQEYPPTYADSYFIEAFNVVGSLAALLIGFFAGRAAWRAISGYKKPDAAPSVTAPAVWMLIGAVASSIMVLFLVSETYPNYTKGQFSAAGMVIRYAVLCAFAATAVLAIRGALKMLGKEDYAASRQAAICSIFSIVGIITLPAGIWALVRLSKPEVKALFPQAQPEPETALKQISCRWEAWWFGRSQGVQKVLSILLGVVFVVSLLCFFSFRMQTTTTADHSGVVRNLRDVTVGLGDPWLYLMHHKTGTRGGMESGMNFLAGSALFGLAALFAGTALTRLTREQKRRGKLADVSADTPQQKFFWSAVAGAVLFIAGGAGVIVHEVRNDNNGSLLADAVHEVHPDFTRPGVTSIALKKAIADELKLTPEQLEKINASLNRAYLDFLKLENEHSEYRSENGHLVKLTKPFPDRSFDLAQRLATELRGIAGKPIIDKRERNAVWKLRLFRHAGEFDVRAELWEKDGKFHRDESWMRDGEKIMGGKSGDTLDDMRLAFGHYVVDWEAQKDIVHEPQPEDAAHSHTLGPDVVLFVIERVRNGELARLLAVKDPDTAVKSGNPHAALVTQAGTHLGRACAETELKRHGIPFAKDATPEDLVKKLEQLLGVPHAP